ncbi:unnamed protein product, partial [Staurois parvus]
GAAGAPRTAEERGEGRRDTETSPAERSSVTAVRSGDMISYSTRDRMDVCGLQRFGGAPWKFTAEKSDVEAVEALMFMSSRWKPEPRSYIDLRPITPASDLSENEDSMITADFNTMPAFVSGAYVVSF